METIFETGCPFMAISWLWYFLAVTISFSIGALWYGVLFIKPWTKAVRYECDCGSDLSQGEKCICKPKASYFFTMFMQFISTALVILMYFILTPISIWLSILVVVSISGWMKSNLKFQINEWKRFVTLASIDIGYFFIVSSIAVGFSLL